MVTYFYAIRVCYEHDYKSLCAAMMICATLVNIKQTERQHLTSLYE